MKKSVEGQRMSVIRKSLSSEDSGRRPMGLLAREKISLHITVKTVSI